VISVGQLMPRSQRSWPPRPIEGTGVARGLPAPEAPAFEPLLVRAQKNATERSGSLGESSRHTRAALKPCTASPCHSPMNSPT